MKLTAKQEKFVLAYIRLGNASASYREAYSAKKMADESVRVEASRLLADPNISLRISELFKPVVASSQLTAGRTLEHLALAAYSTPREEIKWADKLSALDKASKHLGLYERDNAQISKPVSIKMVFE